MANWPWRVSVRLVALAKKTGMVVGIVLVVLLAVRVYLSQQGPELHPWHTWRADERCVRELDNAEQASQLEQQRLGMELETGELTLAQQRQIQQLRVQLQACPQ